MEIAKDRAVELAGGPRALASKLNDLGIEITRQAIEQWRVVPPERVLAVEKITGVSRYELRPDVYGPPPERPIERAVQPAA